MVVLPPGLTRFFLCLGVSGALSSLSKSFIDDPLFLLRVLLAGLLKGDPDSAVVEYEMREKVTGGRESSKTIEEKPPGGGRLRGEETC